MASPVRRSVRGAPPPPSAKPAAPKSTTSSSSLSSARQDRSARTKETSHPHSPSSEDAGDGPPRRSARAHKDEDTSKDAAVEDDDKFHDDEEVTRCICGSEDYLGMSLESEAFAGKSPDLAKEIGDFFVCCDRCSVWQHGGCAGITNEGTVFGNFKYWCEQCKEKLHELNVDSNGQKYSLYLPLYPKRQRKGSVGKDDDKSKKQPSRASIDPSTGKRRGTARSKAAADEEDQLERALAESRRDAEGLELGGRRTKRGRDESEDTQLPIKRQRTVSESIPLLARRASPDEESGDGAETTTQSKAKKARADATQSAREAKLKEKEIEREAARAEAAGRRQQRAGRRRADELETTEESTPKPTPSARTSPPLPSSQPPSPPPKEKAVPKKGPGKKVKKLGNNQYTNKTRTDMVASSPHGRKRQLPHQTTVSGDEGPDPISNGDANTSTSGTSKTSPTATVSIEPPNGVVTKGKFGKGKKAGAANGNGVRAGAGEEVERTWTNMKGALESMSAYVARQDLAGEAAAAAVVGVETSAVVKGGAVKSVEDPAFEELSLEEMAARFQEEVSEWREKYGGFV